MAISNIRSDMGLLMAVAIFRVPSCLAINFDLLDKLQENGLVDYYEIGSLNTEVILYWRQF